MKQKVSLREIVATKILFAVLLAGYYWMWSRSDWKPEYVKIQNAFGTALWVLFMIHAMRITKYKKESMDELAEQNLKRCDSICFKVLTVTMAVVAYLGGILGHVDAISTAQMGWLVVLSLVGISILRTVLFFIMDVKGV